MDESLSLSVFTRLVSAMLCDLVSILIGDLI